LGRFWFAALLGAQLLGLPAGGFIEAPALHLGIEHFQGSAAGVDLVVMGEIGEPFEGAPGGRPDLPIAAQQPLALEQRQWQQPSEIFGVDPQQSRVALSTR